MREVLCYIDKSLDILFIPIPKCGTTYLKKVLFRIKNYRKRLIHYKNVKDKSTYFSFTVIRCPIKRLISTYLMYVRNRKFVEQIISKHPDAFDLSKLNTYAGFEYFATKFIHSETIYEQHLIPMKEYINIDILNQLDRVVLLEDLSDFSRETLRCDVDLNSEIHNTSNNKTEEYYEMLCKNNDLFTKLEKFYKEDFDLIKRCNELRSKTQSPKSAK